MPNNRLLVLFYLVVAGITSGCARVATVSVVRSDGSYKRTVTYRVNEPAKSATGDGSQTSGPGVAKFEDVASLPKGAEWKVTRSKEDSTSVIAASREVIAGADLSGDLGLKAGDSAGPAGKDAPLIANKVTITRAADGTVEYREVLHWTGKSDSELSKADPKVISEIKAVLPVSVRGDSKALTALVVEMQSGFWESLFGAPRPLLSDFMLNTDYATYELQRELLPAFDKALVDQYGTRLTAAERADSAAKLLASLMNSATGKTKPDAAAQSNSGLNLAAMFYEVELPGKVISTNGEANPSKNEVVWSLYSLAPAARDVVLTAKCEAK